MASVKKRHKLSKTKRNVAAPKKNSQWMCPTTLLQMLGQPRRMSSIKVPFFNQRTTWLSSCVIMPESKIIHRLFCIMLTLRRYTHESPGSQYFPKLELDSTSSPPCPQDQCWYKHKREKSNAPVCDQSKKLLVCTTSNIEIPGQGDTHRVKMKSKASSQTTDAVVAEWQSACETHGFAILSQTLRSVLTLPATWASINPPGKDSRKARWLPVL